MAEEREILRRLEGGVLWVTLNRPDAGNAIRTPDMRDDLAATFDEASGDIEVRAVVLGATGDRHFCTGADLRAGRPAPPARPEGAPERIVGEGARVIRLGWQRLVSSILDCEKPVIAAVNGTAAGGGMHLALACDLVVAADEARFISVFVRRGIIPDGAGAYLLARLVGPQRAKQLFFFGDDVPAAEAERMGLVNKVVPRAELDETVGQWAARLAAGPTKAIGLTKILTNRALDGDRATSLWEESVFQEMASSTEDSREGIRAFVERRQPDFKGW